MCPVLSVLRIRHPYASLAMRNAYPFGPTLLYFYSNTCPSPQGRQLLRQYLQEIGYTDTIIDVRSNRVRSLLGLTTNTSLEDSQTVGQDSGDGSNRKLNDGDVE